MSSLAATSDIVTFRSRRPVKISTPHLTKPRDIVKARKNFFEVIRNILSIENTRIVITISYSGGDGRLAWDSLALVNTVHTA